MAGWNQVAGMSGLTPAPQPVMAKPSDPFQGDQPDLSNIPGARVIKNEDRERAGASSASGVRRVR